MSSVSLDIHAVGLRTKEAKVRATGTMIDKLYYLDTVNNVHHASVACDLWHQRLGHASADAIKSANSLVVGADLSKVSVDVCEPCIKGKMSRKPFSKHADIKSCRPLELVHTDVCGPMETKSSGGSVYFVSFIHDYTRYAFLYFIREKSQVFEKFKAFEALATNQVGLAIGTLRSDNGGEYISNEFESYLCTKGIHHQLTVRYTPEQNGTAERYNRTICESAPAMIVQSGLPKCMSEIVFQLKLLINLHMHFGSIKTQYSAS